MTYFRVAFSFTIRTRFVMNMSPPDSSFDSTYRRAGRILLIFFLVHAVLVATHLGEFWPSSIYPMFSQGGNPWSRALVREVSAAPDDSLWAPSTFDTLPGEPFALGQVGVNQNDVANFISKSDTWNERRVGAMRRMFDDALDERGLLLMRADGVIEGDTLTVTFTPFLLLDADSTYFNPNLEYRRN